MIQFVVERPLKRGKSLRRILPIILLPFLLVITFLTVTLAGTDVIAAKKKKKRAPAYTPIQSSLVVDGRTGKILHSRNARKRIYPASLTKVMTLYMIFESLESGKISLNDRFKVSKYATKVIPLKLHLKPGSTIKVKDIILGLIVRSANDAAKVAAEGIGGSEKKFARLMTVRARQLGLKHTTFTNASGLHNVRQKSTAVDLAKLTIAIKRDFPQYYHFFSKTNFKFNGRIIKGHNKVTARYPGAEGLKTGFLNASGCNLITTATRGKKSLVGVVIGSRSAKERNSKMEKLLDQHFGVTKVSASKVGAGKKKRKKAYRKGRTASGSKRVASRG